MKKIHLLFLIALLFPLLDRAQTMLNAGFENWTNGTLWRDPNLYTTSNPQAYIVNGAGNVTRATDSHGGTYAAKLTTVPGVAGMMYIGNFGGGGVFSGGMAFAHHPDSVVGYAKWNLLNTTDTGQFIVLLKKNGALHGGVFQTITGSQSTYARFSTPVNYLGLGNADTLIILLATVTQHSTATPGSYIEVDDVSFVGTNSGSFPNGNFETWTDHNLEEPDNWTSSNSFTTYGGGLVSVDKSTQANSGTYSAHITTQSSAFAGNIAFLLTARLGQNNHMTHEIVYSPIAKLTGYYKYAPVLNDSGEVIINFTKYNGSTMMNDAVDSFHYKFTSAANFTYFELLTPNITGAPDSMWVAILSSNLDGDTTTVHVGSQLWIDDLAFVYPSGISIPYNEYMSHFTISPNPGSDNISLSFTMKNEGDVKIHLYNNAGVEIKNYPLGNLAVGNQSFSPEISELADGIYFFGVETNGKTEMHKFILSR